MKENYHALNNACVIKIKINGRLEYLEKLNKCSFRTSPFLPNAQLFFSGSNELLEANDVMEKNKYEPLMIEVTA